MVSHPNRLSRRQVLAGAMVAGTVSGTVCPCSEGVSSQRARGSGFPDGIFQFSKHPAIPPTRNIVGDPGLARVTSARDLAFCSFR
jgi:hypothetical protein